MPRHLLKESFIILNSTTNANDELGRILNQALCWGIDTNHPHGEELAFQRVSKAVQIVLREVTSALLTLQALVQGQN